MIQLHNVGVLSLLLTTWSASFSPAAEARPVAGGSAARPNIIVIVADDLGYGDLGCTGHPHIRTPHIDRLASEGATFRNYYAPASVCSPSRAAMMTGRLPYRLGIYGFIHQGDPYVHLPPEETTIPQLFRKAGYQTALFGKWHVSLNGARNRWPHIPSMNDYGFDDWFSSDDNTHILNKPGWLRNGEPVGPRTGYAADIVGDEAVDWLTRRRSPDRPFLQFIHFYEPHWLVEAPEELVDRYHGGVTDNRNEAIYFGAVANVDRQVGRVLDALDEQGLTDDTLVLFTSDHGPAILGRGRSLDRNYGTSRPYRGNKYGLWDGSVHVPGLLRWPAVIAADSTIDTAVGSIDLLPTLCALAGVEVPSLELDGTDFSPLLRGQPLTRPRPLQWHHYNATLKHQPNPNAVLREGDFLLCGFYDREPHGTGRWVPAHMPAIRGSPLVRFALHDLRADPTQSTDVSAEHPELARRLREQLVQSHESLQSGAVGWSDARPVVPAADEASRDSRPNILFIVSEDNSDHLGCYGEERVHTPHLDALAAGGVRYTRAYVPYSVCSPSRAAFLTGLYPRQNGHIGLATHRFSMYRDFKTIPAYFREAGYYTGFLGKTHVNPERLVEDHVDHRAIPAANFNKTIGIEEYAEQARMVMQKAAEAGKPFLLIINYADAHRSFVGRSRHGYPTVPVEQEIAPYPWIGSDSPHLRQELRDYLNCINRLDEGIGLVLEELDRRQVRDDTLVMYISDHGADFPRGKGSIYENGTRIPMIVNHPRGFPRGKVEDGMVSTIDVLPTMLTAAGLPVPDHLPGLALQDIDSGKVPPRQHIHTFTTGSSPNLLYVQFGVRDERYKLVYNPDRALNRLAASRYRNSKLPEDQQLQSFLHPPEYELFDLQEDPHEWENLADSQEHQAVRQRLLEAMQGFQRRIRDPFGDPEHLATFIAEQKEYQQKPYKTAGFRWPHLDLFQEAQEVTREVPPRQVLFEQRDIPDGVPLEGHARGAKKYGYRIPSLLVTKQGSVLAFSERRVGLHDHAQNDIVLRRSADGGAAWSDEIVVHEDGMNSINDPLTVQLESGRILLMFARFPYGRHARDAGWIKMADLGYDDPAANVLTFLCHSDDDGRTWSEPVDISRQVKHPELLNANTPGAMIQLTRGPHRGRVVTGLWGTLPIEKDGERSREWRIVVAYSDDGGQSWKRTEPLVDESGAGFPNECQVAEASNGDIVLISRNQGGVRFRKKAISRDGGETWSPLDIDRGLPSVACMGSVIKGPVREDGTWDLWASFPSSAGRKDGQIAVSKDHGRTWHIARVIQGSFAYSALQVSPDGKSLLCLHESDDYRTQTLLAIPFEELDRLVERDAGRPNVLFLCVDDWNDWLGCLGNEQAHTPNVDRLAARGLLFTNAHCVAPVCNPSRVAALTGLRPDTTGVYENNHVMRGKVPEVVTLPQHFRAHGYLVAGGGKVFHDVPPHCHDPASWDEYFWWNEHGPKGGRLDGRWRSPYSIPPDPQPEGRPTRKITPLTKRNFDWAAVDQPESEWPDSMVASWADEFLAREHDRPFFLAVGIFRPHVPWFNPTRYVEQYPLEDIELPRVKEDDLDDLGAWARRRALDGNSKHARLVEFGEWESAVQAYLASISFADASVGRVLDALESSRYRDNTIVVLWSDHGYHLGEKGHWHKRTLWERSTHVPLVIVAPGVTKAGSECQEAVSLLDLYPTLASLCGLEGRSELEGHDLAPLLVEPQVEWPHAAVTTYLRGNHSVRTERWRYIRYETGEEELYDHESDPHEWHNLASDEEYVETRRTLAGHIPVGPSSEVPRK